MDIGVIFSILVTVLIGWQIYIAIDLKRSVKSELKKLTELRENIEQQLLDLEIRARTSNVNTELDIYNNMIGISLHAEWEEKIPYYISCMVFYMEPSQYNERQIEVILQSLKDMIIEYYPKMNKEEKQKVTNGIFRLSEKYDVANEILNALYPVS